MERSYITSCKEILRCKGPELCLGISAVNQDAIDARGEIDPKHFDDMEREYIGRGCLDPKGLKAAVARAKETIG